MLRFSGLTDIGRRRDHNEDSILLDGELFVVCDGMGGHNAGEVASALAIEVIGRFVAQTRTDPDVTWPYGLDPALSYHANRLSASVRLANREVFRKAASSAELRGMGTTVVAAIVAPEEPRLIYAHVGDSRLYLVRDGDIAQLTRDHSLANAAGVRDPQDLDSRMRNMLTAALGVREDIEVDIAEERLNDGDTVLLCSDGLTNMLPDPRILEVVTSHRENLDDACKELVRQANAEGGRDNISVILVSSGR